MGCCEAEATRFTTLRVGRRPLQALLRQPIAGVMYGRCSLVDGQLWGSHSFVDRNSYARDLYLS